MEDFIYQTLTGFSTGMLYWLIAAGLTVAFGVLGILNFAHGSLYMLGGYFALLFYNSLGWNFALSIVLSMICVGIIGFFVELIFLRPIYKHDLEIQLILTFALVLIIAALVLLIWGSATFFPSVPELLSGTISILGRGFPIYSLFMSAGGIAIFIAIRLILSKTWWGKTIRAAASDREMANAIGINIRFLFSTAFVFSAMIAAFGGALSIPIKMCLPGVGAEVIIPAFVVVAIGTLGSLEGAFVGAIIIGIATSLATYYLPFLSELAIYLIMIIILVPMPQGLFGKTA
jgi:branched-subunit amino acid ABC-type transport system permease component